MKRSLDQTMFCPVQPASPFAHPSRGVRGYNRVAIDSQHSRLVQASSSSSLTEFGLFVDSVENVEAVSTPEQRNVRRRISPEHMSPNLAFNSQTTTLQEILTRFQDYAEAKATGRTGVSKAAIKSLCTKRCSAGYAKEKHCCTLCLEDISKGERFTKLPCGHIFHAGSATPSKKSNSCRGILYWLNKNRTCPQCRSELEAEVPTPHPSEQVIVPLLNRQFALIQAQSRLIDRQRREMQELQQRLNEQNHTSELIPSERTHFDFQKARPQVRPCDYQASSEGSQWQDAASHHQERALMLSKVTDIALNTLNWRIINCSQSKLRKLGNLAAKVELILYSEAPDLNSYRDLSTLKERVLGKIRRLIWRAKVLRAQREVLVALEAS